MRKKLTKEDILNVWMKLIKIDYFKIWQMIY